MSRALLSFGGAFIIFFSGVTILATTLGLEGCTKKSETPDIGSGIGANSQTHSQKREVSLAIWANYLPAELQAEFTKQTGIQLRVSNFSSNEELLAKVQAGASGIDVAVPSDYMVDVMIKLALLEPIDSTKIPNRAGIDPQVLKQDYDPENRFSLPYAWSTAGIAINRDLYKGTIRSWKDFFTNKDLAGKVMILDDAREVIGAALKMNGFSVNTVNPAELAKAKETLKAFRPRVKMFRSDVVDPLVNKEVVAAHCYSSEPLLAHTRTDAKIDYIIPEEGGTRAIDNMVIFKGSAHTPEALELINFLLRKETNVAFVKKNFGGPVVLATRAALPPELQKSPILFPAPGSLSKLERIHDLGEANRLYERIWTELKAE